MLQITHAKTILNPIIKNNHRYIQLLQGYGILHDSKILSVAPLDVLVRDYPAASINDFGSCIITPTFANAHTHLEFSAARHGSTHFGSFARWLRSINSTKTSFDKQLCYEPIVRELRDMLRSGVGAIGQISSFGLDFDAISTSPIKTTIFHEILGANANNAEKIIDGFKSRIDAAHQTLPHTTHAASIHSTYSLCSAVYDFALDYVSANDLPLSFHYLESRDESEFLRGGGELLEYLKSFNPTIAPLGVDYMRDFAALKTIFVHCVFMDDFSALAPQHFIAHCPFSNRLLSGGRAFDLSRALECGAQVCLATDGLSSNISLNLFDEARACLLTHQMDFDYLLAQIFWMMTHAPHTALGTRAHSLEPSASASFAVFDIDVGEIAVDGGFDSGLSGIVGASVCDGSSGSSGSLGDFSGGFSGDFVRGGFAVDIDSMADSAALSRVLGEFILRGKFALEVFLDGKRTLS